MRIGACFPTKYVKSSDIPEGKKVLVTIERVTKEDVGGNNDPQDFKPVLYFVDKSKGFVMNRTNYNTILEALGTDDSDVWEGTQILLYTAKTSFQGKMVPCIRVDMPPARHPQRPVARPAPARPAPRKLDHDGEFSADEPNGRGATSAPVNEFAEAGSSGIAEEDIPFIWEGRQQQAI